MTFNHLSARQVVFYAHMTQGDRNEKDLQKQRIGKLREITTKEELQQRLLDIFEIVDSQNSALVGVYKLVFPDWENIKQIEGFPEVGREMWKYICQLFIEFDRQHHPNVFHGGIWLNNGFSSND